MKKKENQRIALTKRLLKESLLRIMEQKSIQKITVSELCEAAEINRSTFYHHYGCPADVLDEIENGVIADLRKIWEAESQKTNWPMNKRIEALCSYFQERRSLSKLLFRDSDTNSEFAALLFQSVPNQLNSSYKGIEDSDDKQLLTTFLNTGAYHMIRMWLLEDIPKTPKEMGELIYQVATQGWEKAD